MVPEQIIKRRQEATRNAIADLIDGHRTPKEIAHRDGVSLDAIYKRRRRFERAAKIMLPRHDKRGRKPNMLAA